MDLIISRHEGTVTDIKMPLPAMLLVSLEEIKDYVVILQRSEEERGMHRVWIMMTNDAHDQRTTIEEILKIWQASDNKAVHLTYYKDPNYYDAVVEAHFQFS